MGSTSSTTDAVSILDSRTGSWRCGVPLPFGMYGAHSVIANGNIVLFGGADSGGRIIDMTIEFDLRTQMWQSRPAMLLPRYRAGLAQTTSAAFVVGGAADWEHATPAVATQIISSNITVISL